MKIAFWSFCMLLLLGTTGCKKETDTKETPTETYTKFQPPSWAADATGKYPATMTAVVALPAALQSTMSETDQLAAFVNDECRGVGVTVKVGTANLFFFLIQGLPDESSKIKFKYYSSKTSYMYESTAAVDFLIDAVYGTAQNPKAVEFSQLK